MFSLRNAVYTMRSLFGVQAKESAIENGIETRWDEEYRRADRINFAEIFANRLAKYTFAGSSITVSDAKMNEILARCMAKSRKWCQTAIGTGRVFLIPYVIGERIYTDIVTQGKAVVTKHEGDEIHGIAVLSDIRCTDEKWFLRWTRYDYDAQKKLFRIENKATRLDGTAEIPLSSVADWGDIVPVIEIEGVERPLFAYVDSPKDNRTTDRLQGAPITFGCDKTIAEIHECLAQYRDEFKLKRTFLGVDRLMLDKQGQPINELYQTFDGKTSESLFEIFSPDIRDSAYRERLLCLFSMLEKQVGTSCGILTPAETSAATATQIRRSMFDTFAMVNDIRSSISAAVRSLCYAYGAYMSLLGIPFDAGYTISFKWGDEFLKDSAESFSQKLSAHGAGAVSRAELRAELYPEETPEEAAQAIRQIDAEEAEAAAQSAADSIFSQTDW